MNDWVEPPRWFAWVCGVVIVAGGFVAVAGAVQIGVTVDETFHVTRLQNYLEHGWYVLDDDLGSRGLGEWVDDAYVYAPITALLLHLPNVIAGNESWSGVSASADAYLVRHLGIVCFGALGVGAAATMARLVSGSRRWGVVAAAVLVAMPMWTGHSMFNVKDVPVATGYSFVTLAGMLFVVVPRCAVRRRFAAAAMIIAGLCLALGTRPAIWPGLALVLAVLLAAVASRPSHNQQREWWRVGDAALATVFALAFLSWVYPALFLHPEQWLMGSAAQSVAYRGDAYRAYVLHEVSATMPLLLLMFGVVGALVRVRRWVADGRPWKPGDIPMALVAAQALFLPALLFLRPAAMSGGLRHVLFAAPAVAVLIAAGIATVLSDQQSRRARRVVVVLASMGLVVPSWTQVQLFPLGYAYLNPASDLLSGDLPADYHQGSLRELTPALPADAFAVCGPALDKDDRPMRQQPFGGQSWLDLSQNCATSGNLSVIQPYLEWPRPQPRSPDVAPNFLALVVDNNPQPQGCQELRRVTRRRLIVEVVASRLLLCPLVVPEYSGPFSLNGSGSGAAHLLGGWSGNGGSEVITVEERASIGFRLDGRSADVTMRLTGRTDGDVRFLVNNSPAKFRELSGGWTVASRGSLQELGDPHNVVLTVLSMGGKAHISRLEVVGAES